MSRSIKYNILKWATCFLLIAGATFQSFEVAAQDFAEANEEAQKDTQKFFSYFADWVVLSHIHRSGENAAAIDNIFNTLLKDYAQNPILQEVLASFTDSQMSQYSQEFFRQTGIRIYFVGQLDFSEGDRFEVVLNHLNNSLKAKIEDPSKPYIIVTNNLKGDNINGYTIKTTVTYSEPVKGAKYKLDRTNDSNPFLASLVTTAGRRNDAGRQIIDAMLAGISTLSERVTENYLPNLLIESRDKLYKDGEEIQSGVLENGTVTLGALNKELEPPTKDVEWLISPQGGQADSATIEGNILTFPIDKAGDYAIKATAGSDEVNVTLRISDSILDLDFKKILEDLLLEILIPLLEEELTRQEELKQKEADSLDLAVSSVTDLEKWNYPISEGDGELVPKTDAPRVYSAAEEQVFNEGPNGSERKKALESLRKSKKLKVDLAKVANLIGFVTNVVSGQGEDRDVVLNDMLDNVGTLLGEMTVALLSGDGKEEAKGIITDYLDKNLSRLAGEDVSLSDLQPLAIVPTSQIPDSFDPNLGYYINPKIPYTDDQLAALVKEITDYKAANPGSFVVVNYSQDIDRASFLARVPKGAPEGYEGQSYKVINIVNYPGSILGDEIGYTSGASGVAANLLRKSSINSQNQYFGFMTPDGKRIILPKGAIPIFFHGISNDTYNDVIPGVLIGFRDFLGQNHWAQFNNNTFTGYKDFTYEKPEISDDDGSVLIGLPYSGTSNNNFAIYKFLLSLEDYDNSQNGIMSISSNEFRQLGLFSSTKMPVRGDTHYRSGNKLLGDGQIDITPFELEILKGRYVDLGQFTGLTTMLPGIVNQPHNEKPEVFTIIKIAEYYNRYPVIFSDYSKWFDVWHFYRPVLFDGTTIQDIVDQVVQIYGSVSGGAWEKANMTAEKLEDQSSPYHQWKNNIDQHNEELYTFYVNFLSGLQSHSETASDNNIACLKSATNKSDEELYACVIRASEDELRQTGVLPFETRIRAMKVILSKFWNDDNNEKTILRLLEHTPSAFDSDKFIQKLEEDCQSISVPKGRNSYETKNLCLWEVLFESVDDSDWFFSGDNRRALMKVLLKHFYKSDRYTGKVQEYKAMLENLDIQGIESQSLTFTNDYKSIYRRIWTDIQIGASHGYYLDAGGIYSSIDTEIGNAENGASQLNISQELKYGLFFVSTQYNKDFKPFDKVSLINLSTNYLLSDYSSQDSQGKPKAIDVPAILLHYISEVDRRETQGDAFQLALDVGTLVIPGGQFAHLSKVGKFIYYADKVSAVTSIAGESFKEGSPELSNFFNKVSLATGIISLGELTVSKKITQIEKTESLLAQTPNQILAKTNDVVDDVIDPDKADLMKSLTQTQRETVIALIQKDKNAFAEVGLLDNAGIARFDQALAVLKADAAFEAFTNIQGNLVKLDATDISKIADNTGSNIPVTGDLANVTRIEIRDKIYDLPKDRKIIDAGNGKYFIPGFCFVAGTPIKVGASEYSPIESIREGQTVYSFNHDNNRSRKSKVSSLFKKTAKKLVKVAISGSLFLSTVNHPYYANGQYVEASQLKAGDKILKYDGKYGLVESVTIKDTTATVYNFQVEGDHNYFIGKGEYLVHNDCNMNRIDEMVSASDVSNAKAIAYYNKVKDLPDDVRVAINGKVAALSDTDLPKFIDDFGSSTDLSKFIGDPDLVDSWNDLYRAGRTSLKTDIEAIEALNALRKYDDAILNRIALNKEVLPYLEGQRAYKELLGDLENLAKKLEENPNTVVNNFEGITIRLDRRNKLSGGTGYSSNQVKGADGVVRAFSDDIDDYVGKNVTFEKTVENARDLNSKSFEDLQVEIEIPDGANTIIYRVEVKNCENCVTSSVIKNQFIERDLFNATSIDQIRWRVYEQNFSSGDLTQFMKENKAALDNLPLEKKNLYFKNFDDLEGITDQNITQFVSDNYNKIFK